MAPVTQASASGTTWSISMGGDVELVRVNLMVVAVYGSLRVPLITAHPLVPALSRTPRRSRRSVSLRWSHPLRSVSVHAAPKRARVYPVIGPRRFTAKVPRTARAVPGSASVMAVVTGSVVVGDVVVVAGAAVVDGV